MSTYQDETSHVWNCVMLLLEWKESEWNPKRMDVYLYARKKDGFARSEKMNSLLITCGLESGTYARKQRFCSLGTTKAEPF